MGWQSGGRGVGRGSGRRRELKGWGGRGRNGVGGGGVMREGMGERKEWEGGPSVARQCRVPFLVLYILAGTPILHVG